jgi:hypothetical protein
LDGIRVVVDGKETPVSELGKRGRNGLTHSLEALYDHYRSGSTIVLNSLGDRWAPLQRMAAALGTDCSARFQVNVYLTPGGNAQGFKPHYDTHDVFIAQVYGSKRWRLYGSSYELPLRDRPHDKSVPEPPLEREIVLTTGDMLYLPRGTVHAASTNQTASVHLTLGVHPVLWSTAFRDAMSELFADDVRFRRGLPLGFAQQPEGRRAVEETFAELLEAMRQQLSPFAMTRDAVRHATSISSPVLRHHLTDLEDLATVGLHTRVRRHAALQWNLTVTNEQLELDFHNKTIRLPAHVAAEVAFVAEAGPGGLTAHDIPGDLDSAGRLVLVQTLVREGFLTLA